MTKTILSILIRQRRTISLLNNTNVDERIAEKNHTLWTQNFRWVGRWLGFGW